MRTVAQPGFRRRRSSAPVWTTLNRFIVFLIFLAAGTVIFFFFQPELNQLDEMRRNHTELQAREEQVLIEQLRLNREKELLATDPSYLENIARDKLDLMKPGETIFRLDSRPSATPSSSAP
jgi:cell division protein FtsB